MMLSIGGTVVSVGGSGIGVSDVAFNELTNWTHSWDALDAVTYIPDSTEISYWVGQNDGLSDIVIDDTPRIASIQDRGTGNRPLLKDTGIWAGIYALDEPLPGPLLVTDPAKFNGRPFWYCDPVLAYQITGLGQGDKSATLVPVSDPRSDDQGFPSPNNVDGSATYFNPPDGYAAPYWLAVIGHLEYIRVTCIDSGQEPPVNVNHDFNPVFSDSLRGRYGAGPTWGHDFGQSNYGSTCWGPKEGHTYWDAPPNEGYGFITGSLDKVYPVYGDTTQNMLAILFVDDGFNASFMELNWREGGKIQRLHQKISQGTSVSALSYPFEELMQGYAETMQNTVLGIKLGTPTEDEIKAVRTWGNKYL